MKKTKTNWEFTWLDCLVLFAMIFIGQIQTLFSYLKNNLLGWVKKGL